MTLVKWSPRRSLFNLSDDLFDGFVNANNFLPRSSENWMPVVDIDENDNAYIVQVELPGMKKEDVNISFSENILTISGEKKLDKEDDNKNYQYYERHFGKFERSFRIHTDIVEDKIEAIFKDGVLTVNLPKAELVKPKQIEVKVK